MNKDAILQGNKPQSSAKLISVQNEILNHILPINVHSGEIHWNTSVVSQVVPITSANDQKNRQVCLTKRHDVETCSLSILGVTRG